MTISTANIDIVRQSQIHGQPVQRNHHGRHQKKQQAPRPGPLKMSEITSRPIDTREQK